MLKRLFTERIEFTWEMPIIGWLVLMYKLSNADKETINKAFDIIWRVYEIKRKVENWQ